MRERAARKAAGSIVLTEKTVRTMRVRDMRDGARLGRRAFHHGIARRPCPAGAPAPAVRFLPVAAAACVLALAVGVLLRSSGINGTSPGGRYSDPLAPAAREAAAAMAAEEFGGDDPLDWAPVSREAWSYRQLLARLGDLEGSPRVDLRAIGEVRYGREAYPIVALTVEAAARGTARTRVLLTSGLHGNERAGPEALARFVESLARSPGLYREVSFDVVPVTNPWGWVHDSRLNGAGKDINRDFASSSTQEASLVRGFVSARIRENGPYHLALDHHESSKSGYFVYQYTSRRSGLGPAFARVVELSGKPLESDYREGGFAVRRGVLSIPAAVLPSVRLERRLSLEQHLRLSGTRHAYTLESPLWDDYADRVRIHGEAVRAMLDACLEQRGLAPEGRRGASAAQPRR